MNYPSNAEDYSKALSSTVPFDPDTVELEVADTTVKVTFPEGSTPQSVIVKSKFDLYYSFTLNDLSSANRKRHILFAGETPISLANQRIKDLWLRATNDEDSGTVYIQCSN